jgi:hypothetical protein
MENGTQFLVMAAVFFIIIPMFKSLWAWMTKEKVPLNSDEIPDSYRQTTIEDWRSAESESMKWWQENMKNPAAFLAVETPDEAIRYYTLKEIPETMPSAVLDGIHVPNSNSIVYTKNAEGTWIEKTQPFQNIINEHFKLKRLFKPVWSYAMKGLKWGIIIGIIFKLLDTAVTLFMVEPGAGVCFIVAIAVCMIPRIGIIGAVVAAFVMGRFYEANFFIMGIASALAGAMIGFLPGMAVGGVIGMIKKNSLLLAPNADPKEDAGIYKAILLPFVSGLIILYLYLFVFNTWLSKVLSK